MFSSNVKRRRVSSSRRNHLSLARSRSRRFSLESLEPRMMLTGTWTPLANVIPASNQGGMQLLTDGSVMEVGTGAQAWVKLTPDATGSYMSGTWSTLASMSTLRDFDATRVLPDGRVLVLGGQYTTPLIPIPTPTPVRSITRSPTNGATLLLSRNRPSAPVPQRYYRMAGCWPAPQVVRKPTSTIQPRTPGPPDQLNSIMTAAPEEHGPNSQMAASYRMMHWARVRGPSDLIPRRILGSILGRYQIRYWPIPNGTVRPFYFPTAACS
jgi:hypothetical protein